MGMVTIGSAPESALVVVIVGSNVDVCSAAVGELVGGPVGYAVGNLAGVVFGPVVGSVKSTIGSAAVGSAMGTDRDVVTRYHRRDDNDGYLDGDSLMYM